MSEPSTGSASPLPEGRADGRGRAADLVMRVIREHEPRPMGCACGAEIGDSIDRRWHLVNRAVSAALGIDPPLGAAPVVAVPEDPTGWCPVCHHEFPHHFEDCPAPAGMKNPLPTGKEN